MHAAADDLALRAQDPARAQEDGHAQEAGEEEPAERDVRLLGRDAGERQGVHAGGVHEAQREPGEEGEPAQAAPARDEVEGDGADHQRAVRVHEEGDQPADQHEEGHEGEDGRAERRREPARKLHGD